MTRKTIAASLVGALLSATSPLLATAGDFEFPSPEQPNCHGQHVAYVVDFWNDPPPPREPRHGLGNQVKQSAGYDSVKQVQEAIAAYCDGE